MSRPINELLAAVVGGHVAFAAVPRGLLRGQHVADRAIVGRGERRARATSKLPTAAAFTQPLSRSSDRPGMLIDPVLTELWIVALCCIVNGTDAWPIHADVVADLVLWREEGRPQA